MQRPAVNLLPEEIRRELDRRLLSQGFSGYSSLEEWLRGEGFTISRSAIHRYGSEFEERVEKLRIAREYATAIASEIGDDENALGDAAVSLGMELIFNILLKINSDDIKEVNLPSLLKALADLQKSAVAGKKFMNEMRTKTKAVAEQVEQSAKSMGLSEEAAAQIRAQILGIAT